MRDPAKRLGITESKVDEGVIGHTRSARHSEAVAAELREDLAAIEAYEQMHGSFAELMPASVYRTAFD